MSQTNRSAGRLGTGLSASIRALEWVSSVLLLAMMLLTFVDVLGRYVFAQPVFGGTEILSAMLALSVFAGLGITNARDDHIVLELFDSHVRRLLGGIYDVLIQGFSIAAMALIAYVLAVAAVEAWHYDARSYVLGIPTGVTVGVISAFAIFSVLSQIAGVILQFRTRDTRRGV